MKTKLVFCAMILGTMIGYGQTPNSSRCPAGLYLTSDGQCVGDQTGDQYPAQDGCNVVTCLDARCQNTSVTSYMCSAVGPTDNKIKRDAVQNLYLSSYFPSVAVYIYPTGNKMMEGFGKDGKVAFTVFRDGRIVLAKNDKK